MEQFHGKILERRALVTRITHAKTTPRLRRLWRHGWGKWGVPTREFHTAFIIRLTAHEKGIGNFFQNN